MSNGVNIGFLNFGIDGQDKPLRDKLANLKEESIQLDKVLSKLNIGSLDTKAFDNVLKKQAKSAASITKDISKNLESIDKVDFSSNIDQMLDKLKEVRNDMTALNELMNETQNTNKKLAIKKEYEQAAHEAEKLMSQISSLEEMQNRLNQSGSILPTRNISDDRQLKQMADYYRELEKSSKAHAKAQEKAQKEAEKLAALREKASERLSAAEAKETARQIAEQEKRTRQAEQTARRTAESQRKAAETIRIEQERISRQVGLTNKTMFSQKELLSQLSNAMGIYFSIYQAGNFVKELAMVSGEFEKQRLSLAAILQNGDAATKIFGQIKNLAVYSPFNFKELTDYAKQLSAFSIPTNEIFDTMKNLADVSAGLGVDMGRIILAYGQVRSAAVLRGQELRQFTEAGIPLVDELAQKFSILEGRVVSAGEVFDKISQRQVPFEMIKEIFDEMTSEGGKFYRMQEIQATSLAGMISNLRDAYDIMLDSIGESNRGLLKGFVGGLVEVMDNWERFANILMGIISVYGIYKTAIIVQTALHGTENSMMIQSVMAGKAKEATLLRQATLYRTLTTAEKLKIATSNKLTTADLRQLAVSGQLTKESALRLIATKQITVAQAGHLKTTLGITKAQIAQAASTGLLNKSMLVLGNSVRSLGMALKTLALNPYTWVLLAIGGIVYALGEWNDRQKEVDDTAKAVAQSVQESYKKISKALEKLNPKIDIALSAKGSDSDIQAAIQEISQVLENNVPEDIFTKMMADADRIDKGVDKLRFLNEALNEVHKTAESTKDAIEVLTKAAFESVDGFLDDGLLTNIKDYNTWFKYYKETQELVKQGLRDNDALVYFKGGLDREKNAFDEDYAGFIENLKKSAFPRVTDWGIDPKLDFGEQTLVVKLREQLLSQIEGISPEIEEEIIKLFNKEFYIDPQIVVDKQVATPLQDAIEQVYSSLGDKSGLVDLTNVMSNQDENMMSWIDRTRSMYAKAKQEREQYNKSLAKGVSLLNDIDYQTKVMKTIEAMSKTMGFDLEKQKKNTGSNKDPYIEKLKKEVDLLRKAKSAYDSLLKVKSKDAADISFRQLDAYENIDLSKLSEAGYEQAIDSIIIDLESRGKKVTQQGKTFLQSLIVGQSDTTLKKIVDTAKKEITQIEKELSGYKEKYSLYEQLHRITGDKGQAAKAVFGIGAAMDDIKKQMAGVFGKGNVDLFCRPMIDAAKLTEKGWKDAGVGIATVFSSQYGVPDMNGDKKEILVTPILPDGSVLTQNELENYIHTSLEGATNILEADILGIVIAVDVDENGKTRELLDELQKSYYSVGNEVISYSDSLKKGFEKLSGIPFSEFMKLDENEIKRSEILAKEGVQRIVDTIAQVEWSEKADFEKKMAELLVKYRTTQEKISLIEAKAEDERKKIREKYGEDSHIAKKLLENSKKAEQEKVDELRSSLFQLTPFYRELFSDLSTISYWHMKKMADNAKGIVDKIANTKLPDGKLKYANYDKDGKPKEYFNEIIKEDRSIERQIISLKDYEKILNRITKIRNEMSSQNPFGELMKKRSEYQEVNSDGNIIKEADNMDIFKAKSQAALEVLASLTTAFRDVFDALGNESAADAMEFIGELSSAMSDFTQGIANRNPIQVIQGIAKGVTAIARNHDKKLDRAIRKSQLEVKRLANAYAQLSRDIQRTLGAVSERQARQMIENQKRQLEELQKQRQAEIDKKKTNWSTVTDMEGQIAEAKDLLRYFYEDLAKEEYDIDLKSWSANLTDAIVDAFAKGEDAVDAFDKAIAQMMKSVIGNMIKLNVIEPAMANLREYLFGDNGVFNDGELSDKDVAGMGRYFKELKGKISQAKDLWDRINAMWETEYGNPLDFDESQKDTLSKGIQALTEDTGHLLGSYINAIRANSSKQLLFVEKILEIMEISQTNFAVKLAVLKQIEANTARSADNSDAILDILKKVTLNGSGAKINV